MGFWESLLEPGELKSEKFEVLGVGDGIYKGEPFCFLIKENPLTFYEVPKELQRFWDLVQPGDLVVVEYHEPLNDREVPVLKQIEIEPRLYSGEASEAKRH